MELLFKATLPTRADERSSLLGMLQKFRETLKTKIPYHVIKPLYCYQTNVIVIIIVVVVAVVVIIILC